MKYSVQVYSEAYYKKLWFFICYKLLFLAYYRKTSKTLVEISPPQARKIAAAGTAGLIPSPELQVSYKWTLHVTRHQQHLALSLLLEVATYL